MSIETEPCTYKLAGPFKGLFLKYSYQVFFYKPNGDNGILRGDVPRGGLLLLLSARRPLTLPP